MLLPHLMAGPSLFLNNFSVLDFAFVSETDGVQGESFYVSAELFGELDRRDFLFDFGPAKKALKALVDDSLDHKLLVPASLCQKVPGGLEFGSWSYRAPASAYEVFSEAEITPAVLEKHLAQIALPQMPANVREVRFTLTPLSTPEATFRYTHGLRFHEGNCQRLLHGHRNPIEVYSSGVRSRELEATLAREWDGAHFVCAATLVNRAELDLPLGIRARQLDGMAQVAYESTQGAFSCALPVSRVVLTEAEPSIETLSRLGIERLQALGHKGQLRVVAYEGLNKGAAATSQ